MAARPSLDSEQAAYEAAVKMLTRKARTTAEVRLELETRGAPADAIASVVARLQSMRHLDDAVLASDEAYTLIEGKGLAPALAVQQLLTRGVQEKLARDSVQAAVEDRSEAELCRRVLDRRLKGRPIDPAQAAKEGRALARLGYEEDVVTAALERATGR